MTLSAEAMGLLRAALPELTEDEVRALSPGELSERLCLVASEGLEWLRRVEAEAPLALARLWTHPTAPCDQRRQVVAGLSQAFSVHLGGNRSGKTHGQLDADVAVALGREHPHTQAWCTLNGVDPELIPYGPGEVVIVAASAGSSRRDHRRAIERRLPPGAEWVGKNGLQEAYVSVTVPGHARQARIWFKSVDQGAKSFKGSEARLYHIDEEPEGPEGKLVVEECLRGASAVGGRVVITGTPQAGLTWMVEDAVIGGWMGAKTLRINSLHNRLAPNYAGLVDWLDRMDPEERAMRERGEWIDRRGAIYPGWSRSLHVVPKRHIPAHCKRYRGLDFGQANPTAAVWAAQLDDGQLVVYRVRKLSGTPYAAWADLIHEAEGAVRGEDGVWRGHTEAVEFGWGDPSSPGAIETLSGLDVPTFPAHREVAAGISAVRQALRLRPDGSPWLVVFEHDEETGTRDLLEEVNGYRYDPNSRAERPLKANDHVMDALRYLVRGLEVMEGGGWSGDSTPGSEEPNTDE